MFNWPRHIYQDFTVLKTRLGVRLSVLFHMNVFLSRSTLLITELFINMMAIVVGSDHLIDRILHKQLDMHSYLKDRHVLVWKIVDYSIVLAHHRVDGRWIDFTGH